MVRQSRSLAPALAALALGGLWPGAAAAAPPERAEHEWAESERAEHERVERERAASAPAPRRPAGSYSTALTLAYALAPLLAIPTGAGLFELTRSDAVAVIGAGLAVVAVPVTTHVLHGEPGRGALSGLFLPLATLTGVAAGGFLGAVIGSAGCDDDSDCELAGGIGGAVLGGLLGGVAGYVSYAIYDVHAHSSLEEPEAGNAALQLWARPVLGRRDEASGQAPLRLGGAMLGVAVAY